MHRRILAGLIAGSSLLVAARQSEAQFFGSSFGSSTYVDRVVDDAINAEKEADEERAGEPVPAPESAEAPEPGTGTVAGPVETSPAWIKSHGAPVRLEEKPAAKPAATGERKRFFRDRVYSLTYEYINRNWSEGFLDLGSDLHVVAPELHLKSEGRNAFTLDLAAAYVRDDTDNGSSVFDSDSYLLSVTPAMELLGRNRDRCVVDEKHKNFLKPGIAIGYRHSDFDTVLGDSAQYEFDSLALVPHLVFTRVTSLQTLVSAVAAYAYETSTSWSDRPLANDGTEGILSMSLRGDVFFPHLPMPCKKDGTRARFSATVQWKHQAQASVRSVEGDDSAEFSTNLTLPLPKEEWWLRFGYAYEALREDYEAHRVQLYIEGPLQKLLGL